jgi:hypothetical protein
MPEAGPSQTSELYNPQRHPPRALKLFRISDPLPIGEWVMAGFEAWWLDVNY